MMTPHNKPNMGEAEARAAADVVRGGYLVDGQQIEQFENEICDFLHLPHGHAVCVSSGSSALFVALRVLGLDGKRVAIPGYVCSSLRHACDLNHSTPVYLDNVTDLPVVSVPSTTQQQDFDGLIYPYIYGLSSHLPQLTCPIIEDLAQSLGAKTAEQHHGTIGDIGVLSFYATKMMTSGGQGGMLVSKDKALITAARDYIHFDQRNDQLSRFNFHLTEMQAAIGRVQLQRLPEFITKRQQRWQIYQDAGLPLLDIDDTTLSHVRYRAVVTTPEPQQLINHLSAHRIKSINPFELSELLSPNCANATDLCQRTVSLPLYPALSIEETQRIATLAKEVL